MTDLASPADQLEPPRRPSVRNVAQAIAVPLGLVALAYGLWFVSDRLLYIGPFDRATFGWGVVVPLWLATPLVAGWAWRGLDRRGRLVGASALALIVGGAAAALLLVAMQRSCTYGRAPGSGFVVFPPLILAALLGGGLGVSAHQAASHAAAGRRIRALIDGVGLQAACMIITIVVATSLLFGMMGLCQRP